MGFTGPEQTLLSQMNVTISERGNVKADYKDFTTNEKGVFAAGDCRRGQSLVVWAINEGRAVAAACNNYVSS
jgi:glutamate synthase (NADPH/NADH) small chain